MKAFCKQKNHKRCKKRNAAKYQNIAKFQCAKCGRLGSSKKQLCKPNRV